MDNIRMNPLNNYNLPNNNKKVNSDNEKNSQENVTESKFSPQKEILPKVPNDAILVAKGINIAKIDKDSGDTKFTFYDFSNFNEFADHLNKIGFKNGDRIRVRRDGGSSVHFIAGADGNLKAVSNEEWRAVSRQIRKDDQPVVINTPVPKP